jgi:DNA gyrase subunit A
VSGSSRGRTSPGTWTSDGDEEAKPAQGALELTSGSVVDVSIDDRMEQAFLDYSMSVIVSRALPDVRDGLKPVQRRILYSMWESGLRPDRPYRKCASAVGEVMKTYHPHGDSSIYDALVRLAQDFTTREPLVDGHGNFGSIDGDPPAAMRYTEARLSPLAMELLEGIDEDTVDEVENYDGYDTEPVVLPARFPNLLVNGASGIAVGMATTIPPHNLGEVIDACLHLVKRPEATVDDLMRFVPAPDLPGGARIVEGPGIREAYVSGRGGITVEAIATTETRTGNLPRIVVTEIPYQVNKASLLERIAGLVADRRLDDIRDLRDESSRDGMRIVIECKRGVDPGGADEALPADRPAHHDQREHGRARRRCTAHPRPARGARRLPRPPARGPHPSHDPPAGACARPCPRRRGAPAAIDALDAVIATIRAADSAADARVALMAGFDLSEIQAQAVLDLQLRRLAALERSQLEDEYQELVERIAGLERILGDTVVLDGLLVEELKDVRRRFANERRTRLEAARTPEDGEEGTEAAPTFEAQEVTIAVTRSGVVRSVARRRASPALATAADPAVAVLRATTEDTLILVDAGGTAHRIASATCPSSGRRHAGRTSAVCSAVVRTDRSSGRSSSLRTSTRSPS